jgi:hypothetical protein
MSLKTATQTGARSTLSYKWILTLCRAGASIVLFNNGLSIEPATSAMLKWDGQMYKMQI